MASVYEKLKLVTDMFIQFNDIVSVTKIRPGGVPGVGSGFYTTMAIRTTVVPIRILICTTVVSIRILIRTTAIISALS